MLVRRPPPDGRVQGPGFLCRSSRYACAAIVGQQDQPATESAHHVVGDRRPPMRSRHEHDPLHVRLRLEVKLLASASRDLRAQISSDRSAPSGRRSRARPRCAGFAASPDQPAHAMADQHHVANRGIGPAGSIVGHDLVERLSQDRRVTREAQPRRISEEPDLDTRSRKAGSMRQIAQHVAPGQRARDQAMHQHDGNLARAGRARPCRDWPLAWLLSGRRSRR